MGKEKGGRDADDAVRMGIRDGKKKTRRGEELDASCIGGRGRCCTVRDKNRLHPAVRQDVQTVRASDISPLPQHNRRPAHHTNTHNSMRRVTHTSKTSRVRWR